MFHLLLLIVLNPPAPARELCPYVTSMGFAVELLGVAGVAYRPGHPILLKTSRLLGIPALLPGEAQASTSRDHGLALLTPLSWFVCRGFGWVFVFFFLLYTGKETFNLQQVSREKFL